MWYRPPELLLGAVRYAQINDRYACCDVMMKVCLLCIQFVQLWMQCRYLERGKWLCIFFFVVYSNTRLCFFLSKRGVCGLSLYY